MDIKDEFIELIKNNNIENVKSFLNNHNIDSSCYGNYAICFSSTNGYTEITNLLFKDNRVKICLEKYNKFLYNNYFNSFKNRHTFNVYFIYFLANIYYNSHIIRNKRVLFFYEYICTISRSSRTK